MEPARRTRRERLKQGRTQRKIVSRTALGELHTHNRGFDPIAVLRSSAAQRIPRLLPVKYTRMAASPFAFFRGAVSIMAADLASRPHTGLLVQLCGDAHVQNMGSFESPDGRILFDINDFDETITGPWEWDVKRMAASIVLAGYESNHARPDCTKAVHVFLGSYCRLIEELSAAPILAGARYQIQRTERAQAVSAALKQAERATPADLVSKYTTSTARRTVRFRRVEQTLWPLKSTGRQNVLDCLPLYAESLAPERHHLFNFFKPLDVAFKIVGTGSVGLRDYVVLLEGNGPGDPLFLQIKQETESAYAPYLQNSTFPHQGRRVAEGQLRIQPLSDPLLGWTRIGAYDFLVRQLNDHKGSINIENLREGGLASLADIAGKLLARGHARSGDAAEIAGYIGKPARVVGPLTAYALDYAAQTQHDFEQFHKAIKAGKIRITT